MLENEQYPEPSQHDSGIFGTEGSDANHSTMSQKGQHFGGRPGFHARYPPYPEFPPSLLHPKLPLSVSVEDVHGPEDLIENLPENIQYSHRPTYRRGYLPSHTLSQQEPHEWRHNMHGVGSPASLSQTSHPPLRQKYLEGFPLYRKQTGSPASSEGSSCYSSANERLRSAPGSVISVPGSTISSSTTSSFSSSSRSGSKGVLPRPSVTGMPPTSGMRQGHHHHHHHPSSIIPQFMRKTRSEVPTSFPQHYKQGTRYESESPEDESVSMPTLPSVKKGPNPARPAPPPPSHRGEREREAVSLRPEFYRQKKQTDKPQEDGRNRESLKMKLDMLIHVIKMFSTKTGKENDGDAANLLLALSRTTETVEVMYQPACLTMLIQIIHNIEHKDDRNHQDIRLRAAETLRNIIKSKSDTRQGKHDLVVLNVLESIRAHCDMLFDFIASHDKGQRINSEAHESLQEACDGLLAPIRKLYKYSNDKEKYRPSILTLGGIQSAAEVLIANFRLLAVQKKSSGRHGEEKVCHSSKIITVVISILINLTYGDVDNKSTLCAFRDFLKALVYHIYLQNESIIASGAQVLRNLSWRATPDIKDALLNHEVAVALMAAVDFCREESTIQYITSALWNLSAHSLESRIIITSTQRGIKQLVNLLSYNSPSGTTAVVENVGGILKNLSVVIKDEKYRKKFREAGGLAKLANHLKSKNKTVLANATGILWNISAHHHEDQKILWDLGCIPLLDIHRTSDHKSIRENARGALRNLLAFGQNNGWCSKSDVMGYNLKTQKSLSKSLCNTASYTFNHLSQPQSQKHSSESLNAKAIPGRSKSSNGAKGSTSSLSQPKPSFDRRYNYQYPMVEENDFGGASSKQKTKNRLKFTRIASAPQASSMNKEEMELDDERFSYMPYTPAGSKHTAPMESSYPDDCSYPEDHSYPDPSERRVRMKRPAKQDSCTGLSPYGYSYSQEAHGLSAVPLSNEHSDATTSLSVLESKLEKFDLNQPSQSQEVSYVELEPDIEDEDDIDNPIGGDHNQVGSQKHSSSSSSSSSSASQSYSHSAKHPSNGRLSNESPSKPLGTGNLALDGTNDEGMKKIKGGKRSEV